MHYYLINIVNIKIQSLNFFYKTTQISFSNSISISNSIQISDSWSKGFSPGIVSE